MLTIEPHPQPLTTTGCLLSTQYHSTVGDGRMTNQRMH